MNDLRLSACCVLAFAVAPGFVDADQNQQTSRLEWLDVDPGDDHPTLLAGHAIDVHTEGSPTASIQSFFVNGAKPSASYEAVYLIDGIETDLCSGVFTFPFQPMVYLNTNERGMGTARFRFAQDELGIYEVLFGVRFQLVDTESGTVAYETPCLITSNDL